MAAQEAQTKRNTVLSNGRRSRSPLGDWPKLWLWTSAWVPPPGAPGLQLPEILSSTAGSEGFLGVVVQEPLGPQGRVGKAFCSL